MIVSPDEQRTYLAEMEYTPHPRTQILAEEEQADCREEIDYLIAMHGPEYVWGMETAMEKARGLIVVVPGRIAEGLSNLASNPTIIAMNEKAKAMNARLCEEEECRARQMRAEHDNQEPRRKRHKPPGGFGGGGLGGGINLDFGDDRL